MIYHFPRDIAIIVPCLTTNGLLVSKSVKFIVLWLKSGNYVTFNLQGKSDVLELTMDSVRVLNILDYYCNYSLIQRVIKGERPRFVKLLEVESFCYKKL